MTSHHREMAATMRAVSRVVTWAGGVALKHPQLSKASINAMRVCIQEIVSNVALHAKRLDGVPTVRVSLRIDDERIIVRIEDNGPPFDPVKQPPGKPDTDLASADHGGRGLRIVRTITRQMSYMRAGEWNCLQLEIA